MADPISPFTPDMLAQISQLIQQQTDRSARTAPIHQAAMAMATRMAPGYAQSAMTAPSSAPAGGGLTPPSSSGSTGPGVGTTAATLAFTALLKNPQFMAALKGMFGGGADSTFGGLIQGNKPFAGPGGPTGFPNAPVGGSPSHAGGSSGIPGYFKNPDGSFVQIPGDPANGGGYGGGLFPVSGDPRFD